jgi:predicted lipid carrier protein YhbT
MASVKECERALRGLANSLAEVDPEVRARHVPHRRVACRIKDLDVVYTARLDEDGVHGLAPSSPRDTVPEDAEVKVAVDSDDLLALASGEDDFLQAWLRGRLQISAPVRDMLRLRALVGL